MNKKHLFVMTIVIIAVVAVFVNNYWKPFRGKERIMGENNFNTSKNLHTLPISTFTQKQTVFPRVVIEPVDQSCVNFDFKLFRDQLLKALDQKDLQFLVDHLDPSIEYSFGADQPGVKGFLNEWQLEENPDQSKVWDVLKKILILGGRFDKDGKFTVPYTFTDFLDSSKYNCFVDYVILEKDVKVYEKPNSNSKVISNLSYEIVRWGDFYKDVELSNWMPVITSTGIEGFVGRNQARSPVDYRATFAKKNGDWKMVFLINGD